jgi:serine/threonine protein kinase
LLIEAICDYAADLWGFGCLLYELYFGCAPFEDADEYTVFKKIQEA